MGARERSFSFNTSADRVVRRLAGRIFPILTNLARSEPEGNPWTRRVFKGFLFIIGLAAWGWFLNWGSIPFDFHDWSEITAPRLAFLQEDAV